MNDHRADIDVRSQGNAFLRLDLKSVPLFLGFVAAYFVAYRFGMSFSHATASPFWFPDSILLCALLNSRPRNWWILVLATLPIRLFSDVARELPQWFLLGSFAVDSAKGVITALVLRRLMDHPTNPRTVRDLVVFVLVAALLMPLASAFCGAALRSPLGHNYWPSVQSWFLGDALAELVVTPFILYWVFSAPWRAWGADGRRYAEAIFLLACVMVTGYLAANTPASSIYFAAARFYAPVPFLFWAAIRFGIPGAAGAMAVMAVFAVEAAMVGNGPFAGRSPADTALLLQNFLLLRSVPLYFVAALVDQMRAAERTVRESEERFRRLAHSAPTLIWLAGTDKLCEFVNQYWQDFTGRSLEQELGDGWTKGIHPEDYNYCVDGYFSAFDARKAFELEYRLRRHDGEYRWILDKGIPRYSQTGDFIGYVGSALDITDLKRAQETSRALAHAHRLAVMGELTATIAHEVRQPLSAISLNAQAAGKLIDMDNPPLQDLREMVLDIRDSVLRVDAVIARIRAYLQKREVRMEAVDPNLVAHDVLWLLTSDAQRRGVRLQSDLGRDLPLILADRTQLQQVLLNLIVYSMDAMADVPELQRSIGIQTKRAHADQVEFIVTDRGCGIPADQLTQLFESFFTSGPDSMGLGLSVARSLVEAHQGRIWAENNASGGAAFHFTIPVARPGAHREAQAVADAVLE